ncbi:MAG TPA: putative PEP-binding protein [Spirochaetia bacterium]|nr:putative PEP-binding protein [Spirochaetia bacterium]
MKKNIWYFAKGEANTKSEVLEKIGIRGRLAMELADLKLPILPGFVIDADVAAHLKDFNIWAALKPWMERLAKITGKSFGDTENPLLVKIVVSPNLVIASYPTLHNYGLTEKTLAGFNRFVGENFGTHEMQFLTRGNLEIEAAIAEFENKEKEAKNLRQAMKDLDAELDSEMDAKKRKASLARYQKMLPDGFFADPFDQLEIALKRISHLLSITDQNQEDTGLLIQPMVYGNYGKDSLNGQFFTRNIVTGEKEIQGEFFQNKFNAIGAKGADITAIAKNYHADLEKIAHTVEDHFKEIRSIRFTVENKRLWLIDQRGVMTKSTQADIQLLLDLNQRKIVNDAYVVKQIKPGQLNEILHPIIDFTSVKGLKMLSGGITGAPGAAIGRIFFSTDGLLDAHKIAQQKGQDTKLILCLVSSFAEDVKAIEVATGVLSTEGGYSAHASVVARQYGKVSLVKPDMKIKGKQATVAGITIKEGDYITLNVPFYGAPSMYIGKADLIEPDPEESGMLDFLDLVKKYVTGFHVRANSDKPRDAALARKFGARGIGLVRTEHMFFDEKRINVFREMVLSESVEERKRALQKLLPMQKADFYKLLKIMEGYPVIIRLLDAPLHEFLPHNDQELERFMKYLNVGKSGAKRVSEKDVRAKSEAMHEFNPMLGHRGCRIAVSYPEIYEMQVRAIFEAVYALKKEGVHVEPEVMIPIIMNENELKLIIYGKKIEGKSIQGLVDVERSVRESFKAKPAPYKIGTMVELPAAALGAGSLAHYAQFFSFGTNDLTQTTIGLSRDDFNTFMPDYTQFDLLEGNPFQNLNPEVRELIAMAVKRGRMTRPDLEVGLCGEHGAIPENIKFCMEAGLDYVSCSPYQVPLSMLAIAQLNLEKSGE